MPTLSEAEFSDLAAVELRLLMDALDRIVDGVEAELSGDILSLELADGSQYVINSHTAARQIWMAAERSAWHFDYLPATNTWVASKSGDELWSALQKVLQEKLGPSLQLSRPLAH